jgi:misacylated tRNA(Ala) deacylase
MTELLFLDDAYLRACDATVTKVDGEEHRVVLDRTVFYATGGGQPHDTGTLSAGDAVASVVNVRKADGEVWHWLDPEAPLPELGSTVAAEIDWDRRHQLMRTHSALHTMGGVIWNEYGALATGGNMDPLKGRLD